MASGSQNMTTYNARTVTGSSSAASPAGALLLSGAGRANDATGDTWLFFDSGSDTSTPWGIKHDQANNKIHIYGNNTDSVWTRMNTGDTYILGKVGIGYDPETSENLYKLYVNGTSLYTGRLYGNTGNGLEVQSLDTSNWKEGIRIYNASNNYSVLCLCNNDLSDLLSLVHSGSAHSYYIDIENNGTYSKINIPSKHSGTMALTDGYGASGTWGISITGTATAANYLHLYEARGTTTTLNKTANYIGAGKMFHLVASSSTSAENNGKPPCGDANILQMNWDNSGGYDAQLAIGTPAGNDCKLEYRSRVSTNAAWRRCVTVTPGSSVGNSNTPIYIDAGGIAQVGNNKLGAINANGYWGMRGADNGDSWIRTTSSGIIPVQSGGRGAGHCGLGTSSWYFSSAYVDTYYANRYSTGHGYINGAATNGGINMILAGDDVWLGDCNAGGILGLKAANSTNCGLYFYNSSGTQIGQFYADGTTIQCNKSIVSSCEFIGNTSQGFRLINNNRGVFWHWNGSTPQFYLMFTDAGNPCGSWNSARPFYVNASNYYSYFVRAYNAVWNDFAEFRTGVTEEGGWVVYDNESGIMKKTTKRLQAAARITSDTFGCAVGQSDTAKTPIGVGGRVLAYPYQDRNNYKIGDAVCSAPGGTVDIMTRDEIMMYPDRIIGIVSEIPDYPVWNSTLSIEGGGANTVSIEVKGRIWIYVR